MQSRDNKDFIQLLCQNYINREDYTNFCLVCKLWNEIGKLLQNIMANKFKMYCYTQKQENLGGGEYYIKLVEYYHLPNDRLHGDWKVTITFKKKKQELIRYMYSFGNLIETASREDIERLFSELELPSWSKNVYL